MAISLQSGIREYTGDLSPYTGMLGGLTPDVHTLRALNPATTNRVICVMYRGPYFLMHYFGGVNAYNPSNEFGTYKKILEYFNTGIQCNFNDQSLNSAPLQGGFAGRTISVPTVQNAQQGQTLTITVPEMVGHPVANVHNMWIDGISDPITGLTHYHGLVAGSVKDDIPQRIFKTSSDYTEALDPSPAWEVAEFLVIALDRSGARVEGAVMALGCIPTAKIGLNDTFNHTNTGQSNLLNLQVTFNCQFVQSAFVNDLATRYVRQFAVFGNSLNFNPGAGDAFFQDVTRSTTIDTAMFNRPTLDAVQSGVGNAPVFKADNQYVTRSGAAEHTITPMDHSQLYGDNENGQVANPTPVTKPYQSSGASVR